nr:tetratricopeptide repeat protein [Rhizobium sp. ACO-34A]
MAMEATEPPPELQGDQSKADIVEAQLMLGQMALDRGEHDAAFEWFRVAAMGGDARALNMLGRCFERGWGTAPDLARAHDYFFHAAERGDAWAMFNLADLCSQSGAYRDDAKAYALYVEAARRGVGKALNMIGLFHEDGRVVPADREQAATFFLAGAEGGDCWAQMNHARLLIENGNIDSALPWLERSLESGFPDFWATLGTGFAEHAEPRLRDICRRALALAASSERNA